MLERVSCSPHSWPQCSAVGWLSDRLVLAAQLFTVLTPQNGIGSWCLNLSPHMIQLSEADRKFVCRPFQWILVCDHVIINEWFVTHSMHCTLHLDHYFTVYMCCPVYVPCGCCQGQLSLITRRLTSCTKLARPICDCDFDLSTSRHEWLIFWRVYTGVLYSIIDWGVSQFLVMYTTVL